jgi:hypothetical protein
MSVELSGDARNREKLCFQAFPVSYQRPIDGTSRPLSGNRWLVDYRFGYVLRDAFRTKMPPAAIGWASGP